MINCFSFLTGISLYWCTLTLFSSKPLSSCTCIYILQETIYSVLQDQQSRFRMYMYACILNILTCRDHCTINCKHLSTWFKRKPLFIILIGKSTNSLNYYYNGTSYICYYTCMCASKVICSRLLALTVYSVI